MPLVERDDETAAIGTVMDGVAEGAGGVLAFEGPPGIGKTRLLAEARAVAMRRGATVLTARGAEFERDFAFGVVRQWLEPVVARAEPRRRARLLSGAASLAERVLTDEPQRAAAAGAASPATLHGLYWLVAALAEESPLLLVLDDAHHADEESLRLVSYLAARLEGLALAAVLAVRRPERRASGALAGLLAEARVRVVRPASLSEAAVGAFLTPGSEAPFRRACHVATLGNPFLLTALSRLLADEGVTPVAGHAARVGELRPRELAHTVMARLEPPVRRLAHAVAILERDVTVADSAALAGLTGPQAAAATETLVAEGMLDDARPLAFVHPLVRAAVLSSLSAGERASAHGRAASVLRVVGGAPDRVAAHLLATEPAGRPTVVEALSGAAERALARGAPGAAVRLLRRALAEPPGADRRESVLAGLATAELLARDPAASDRLGDAIAAVGDPVWRGSLRLQLGMALFFEDRRAEAQTMLEGAIAELGDADAALTLRLETQLAQISCVQIGGIESFEARVPRLRALAAAGRVGSRGLALTLGLRDVLRGCPAPEVVGAIREALGDGAFLAEETADSPAAVQAVGALAGLDELDEADRLLDAMAVEAAQTGSVLAYVTVGTWRAYVALRRGQVLAAEAEAREALVLIEAHGLQFAAAFCAAIHGHALLSQGRIDEAAAVIDGVAPDVAAGTVGEGWMLDVRGRLRAAQGRADDAAANLRACGAIHDALAIHNPAFMPWRSELALALPATALDEARALVDAEVALALRSGSASAVCRALRARGLLERDGAVKTQEAALAALGGSPAALERALTLVALGGALRRRGRRMDAREPLREALELADSLGAGAVASVARAELLATGARPRRVARSGAASLSPTERRVASMAGDGRSNPEIAQALFVSRKTVEMHLSHVYRKLGIASRRDLPRALAA